MSISRPVDADRCSASGRSHAPLDEPGGPRAPRPDTGQGRTAPQEFRHDAPTVLSYGALVCFAFWNYGYGPALALLRGELHFSYTVLGAYTASWAGGAVVTGLAFPHVSHRLARPALLCGSSLLAAGGAAVFTLGAGVAVTLLGAGVLGLGATMLLTGIQAVLSDRHGSQRERALTEANIGAAACAVVAPLALGALAGGPAGWRTGFALPVVGLAVLALRYRREPLPTAAVPPETRSLGRLPSACWLLAGLAATSMAVEFCLVYFGAEQLEATGLSTAAAVTALSSHYLGLLAGRVGGAVATRRSGRTIPLLYTSLAVTAGGFLLFWLTALPELAVVGLFIAGLGVANLYPLSVALSLAAAPGREDQANSRSQLLGGLLVIGAPFLLGSLADPLGLTAAFAIEPVLICLCLLLLVAGLRAGRETA
jgi:MFS family permease